MKQDQEDGALERRMDAAKPALARWMATTKPASQARSIYAEYAEDIKTLIASLYTVDQIVEYLTSVKGLHATKAGLNAYLRRAYKAAPVTAIRKES